MNYVNKSWRISPMFFSAINFHTVSLLCQRASMQLQLRNIYGSSPPGSVLTRECESVTSEVEYHLIAIGHGPISNYIRAVCATEHSPTCKSHFHKPQQAQYLSVTEERY
jgi:hypothetical protein